MANLRLLVYLNALNEVVPNGAVEEPAAVDLMPWSEQHNISLREFLPLLTPEQMLSSTYSTPRKGDPLPNAMLTQTVFLRLQMPSRLVNPMKKNILRQTKEGTFDLKAVTNTEFLVDIQPIWTDTELQDLWISIFHQLEILLLYFLYFIDRLVNILVKASDAVVNGDIDFGSLPLTGLATSLPGSEYLGQFFYNKLDLNKLTRKSYAVYGRLIRELRLLLNVLHHEYPAKMSLLSLWLCYLNIATDFDTHCLMVGGTVLVMRKIFSTHQSHDLSSAIQREMQMLESFCFTSKVPDYHFGVIIELSETLSQFQNFTKLLISKYEAGESLCSSAVALLRDPVFLHEFHELDKFLTRLQEHYFPTIQLINAHYKQLYNMEDDSNLHFVSPTIIFQMAYEWFKIYPGGTDSRSTKLNPVKRALYIFYRALGICMNQVFTPLRSISFVDANHVAYFKVGFRMPSFDMQDQPIYKPLEPIVMGLVKTIKFFEYRLMLYSLNRSKSSVLDEKFVRGVTEGAPESWPFRDIVHIVPRKLDVNESQMTSMTKSLVTANNLPFFESVHDDPKMSFLIQQEMKRQYNAVQKEVWTFDFESGLLNHDFNPKLVIELLLHRREESRPCPGTDMLESRIGELSISREAVTEAAHCGANGIHNLLNSD